MLTIACAELIGYQGNRHHKLAAAVEFIHTATLLHDDVVDGSDLRRGKETANIVFGNPATVLVGDFLFSRAFELMVEDGSLKVLKILAGASAIIAEGEVDQLTAQRQIETSEERYLSIIGAKTAALFCAACRIAAVVAERGEAEERALDDYGRNLGIAFQLADDAIDYDSDAHEMGKAKGDDFRDGKMTLPVILAYARGNDEERQFWRDAIAGFCTSDEDLAHAVKLIAKYDTVSATRERARHFAQRAIDALPGSPPARLALRWARRLCSRFLAGIKLKENAGGYPSRSHNVFRRGGGGAELVRLGSPPAQLGAPQAFQSLIPRCPIVPACGAASCAPWPNPWRNVDIKGSARAMALASSLSPLIPPKPAA
jgi:octaprenyl-diphosphate synthase